jgi:predicted transcriptional regulator
MTYAVTHMTAHVSRLGLDNRIRSKGEKNHQMIIDAIIELKNPQPSEIRKYINNKVKEEAEEKYELGEIDGSKKRKYVKDNTMAMRTILRHLLVLTEQGLLEHNDSRYSLSPNADVRFFANLFALGVFRYVGDFPIKRPLEDNVVEFIDRIGAVIFYAFIQSARPIEDDSMTRAEKENLTSTWIRNAIPIYDLYKLFFYSFAPDDIKYDQTRPDYILDVDTLRKLVQTFKKLYPEIYKGLTEQANYFVPGNKLKFIEEKKTGGFVSTQNLGEYDNR